jgi:hypothetical protein
VDRRRAKDRDREGRGGRQHGGQSEGRERGGGGGRPGAPEEGLTEHEFREKVRVRLDRIDDRLDRLEERVERLLESGGRSEGG